MPEKTVKEQIDEALGGVIEKLTGTLDKKIGDVVGAAVKPFGEQLGELAKNHGILADTLKNLPPAAAADKKEGASGTATPLTMEGILANVGKLVTDQFAAREAKGAKSAVRQKVIGAKLKDVPDVYHALLPDSEKEEDLLAAADKIVERVNNELKVRTTNQGGASKDGGTTPAEGAAAAGGARKGFLQMPGAAA